MYLEWFGGEVTACWKRGGGEAWMQSARWKEKPGRSRAGHPDCIDHAIEKASKQRTLVKAGWTPHESIQPTHRE